MTETCRRTALSPLLLDASFLSDMRHDGMIFHGEPMVENPDNPQPPQPGQTTAATLRPMRRGLIIVLGVISSAPVVDFLSKD